MFKSRTQEEAGAKALYWTVAPACTALDIKHRISGLNHRSPQQVRVRHKIIHTGDLAVDSESKVKSRTNTVKYPLVVKPERVRERDHPRP